MIIQVYRFSLGSSGPERIEKTIRRCMGVSSGVRRCFDMNSKDFKKGNKIVRYKGLVRSIERRDVTKLYCTFHLQD